MATLILIFLLCKILNIFWELFIKDRFYKKQANNSCNTTNILLKNNTHRLPEYELGFNKTDLD